LIPVFDFFLIAFTSASVFFDLTDRRIPNWLILFGLAAAVVLNAIQGFSPLSQSFFGFLIGIGVLIVPFALGWLGAGDVKYFGVVGAFLGVAWLPRIAFYMALAAGALALAHVIVNGFQTRGFKELRVDFRLAITSFGHILPGPIATKIDKGGHGVPWGVAIGAGTIIAYYFDPRGRWAGF
jgi:prepilin peptidase CpaA